MAKLQKFLKTINIAAVSALFWLFSAIGNAETISTSTPYNFDWIYSTGTAAGDLTGTGSMTISGFNSAMLTVLVTLNNNSLLPSDRLVSFGFGIDPNAIGVTFTDSDTTGMTAATLGDIPSMKLIEVCAISGPNCDGGGGDGIYGGTSDTFTMYLTTGTISKVQGQTTITPGVWGSSVNIAPIGFKYQTGSGSFEFTSSSNGGLTSSGGNIPEPGILALLSAGLLGQALLIRKRRRQQK